MNQASAKCAHKTVTEQYKASSANAKQHNTSGKFLSAVQSATERHTTGQEFALGTSNY